MKDRNGKNVCVAIELEKQIQNGAEYLEVNDVRSFHGREFKNIVDPIVNNNTLQWVDKEKGLAYLSSASRYVQQEIDKQVLSSAAKIAKDFDNPQLPDKERLNEDTLFRKDEQVHYEKALARKQYEDHVSSGVYQTQEALQDSMLGLKEAMSAILKAEGANTEMEEVGDFENAYWGENHLSSINKAEIDAFARLLFKPLLSEVAKLAKTKEERRALTEYMIAKHGLERNQVMATRDAKKAEQKDPQKTFNQWLNEFRQ